jgi:histone deacetylase complex subunit SAP18
MLLTSALPDVLPRNPVGTRLGFRLVYPDLSAKAGRLDEGGKGRYISREMGSVVVGAAALEGERNGSGYELGGEDAEKTLEEVRFVIGDFVDCAVFPPLSDGSVVGRGNVVLAGRGRENGHAPRGRGGYVLGGRGRGDYGGGGAIPSGEWRRGETPGYRGGGGYGRGRGRY